MVNVASAYGKDGSLRFPFPQLLSILVPCPLPHTVKGCCFTSGQHK